MGDDLKLVELRDKDVVWRRLEAEFDKAYKDLGLFLQSFFAEEPRLRPLPKQLLVRDYFMALLSESRYALYVSQNGRYFEFRCMEELLVRYRQTNIQTWAKEGNQHRFQPPPIGGFIFAKEHLDVTRGSEMTAILWKLRHMD